MDVAGKRPEHVPQSQSQMMNASGEDAVPLRFRWYNLALGFVHLAQAMRHHGPVE